MNRRSFVRALGLGTIGLVASAEFDVERLLWIPRQMVAVPSCYGDSWITRETARCFMNDLQFATFVDRRYAEAFLIGNRLNVKLPQRFIYSRFY